MSCLFDAATGDGGIDDHFAEAVGVGWEAQREELDAEDGGQGVPHVPTEGCCDGFCGLEWHPVA